MQARCLPGEILEKPTGKWGALDQGATEWARPPQTVAVRQQHEREVAFGHLEIRVADVAAQFGLRGLKPVRSIGLGSNEASLLQITSAFRALHASYGFDRPVAGKTGTSAPNSCRLERVRLGLSCFCLSCGGRDAPEFTVSHRPRR